MSYGEIDYNEYGQPKCEICGEYFDRVSSHVRQKHELSAREYKKKYGLDLSKGICSKVSSEKSREKVYDNYDKVIGNNLVKNGEPTRFKNGSKGRTKDQVSEQTRRMLIAKGFQKKLNNIYLENN
tara:strand:- start:11126 stop:11500 length:375 start_codon:yes stop_codon:yes gene_type:complete